MKRLCYSAFVAFWSCIATLLAVQVLATDEPAAGDETAVYSMRDVAAHDHEGSCWMVIEGKVYDLTEYLPKHPTPPSVVLSWCGGEATEGMRTKGYGRDHSPAAWGMLEDYLIGTLQAPRDGD